MNDYTADVLAEFDCIAHLMMDFVREKLGSDIRVTITDRHAQIDRIPLYSVLHISEKGE